ncbi:MAG: SDR family oxidoreductase [Gemmatimonadaceae bacterium]|nr:SDR family oxidoreductase [Gemmatimonadaceae bacterium]
MADALAGEVAVVTGASRGIGAAIACALAGAGARVALVSRDAAALATLTRTLPGSALAFAADLARGDEVTRVADAVRGALGDPGILVNNAGAFAIGPVGSLSLTDADHMVQVNLLAPYRLLHQFLPAMRTRGRGDVVMIGSVADHDALPENGAYAATKYGARGIHEVLGVELRGTGVRATLISPGPVNTPLWDAIPREGREGLPTLSDMLRPADVADAVLWALTRPRHVSVSEVRLGHA